MEPEQGGLTIGSTVALLGAIMFILYIGYRISLQRDELRNTIELITNEHENFVNSLEAFVQSETIRPIAGNM